VGPPPRLELLGDDGRPGTCFPLAGAVTIVGRKPGAADIVLVDDPLVSARHLRLCLTDGRVVVEDLRSCNGTYLLLADGDVVRPGEVFLVGTYTFRTAAAGGATR
jgi:pSer/pThr/pTyr-binding forkhead associated (FHA) protein